MKREDIDLDEMREFFATHFEITKPEDMYDFLSGRLRKPGGWKYLSAFNESTDEMAEALFPDFDWTWWKFRRAPRDIFTTKTERGRVAPQI